MPVNILPYFYIRVKACGEKGLRGKMRRAKGLQGQNAPGITLQLAAADKVFSRLSRNALLKKKAHARAAVV